MTFLYRPFNGAGQLLYIGIAEDLYERMTVHSATSPWFNSAERLVVECYNTRALAMTAELAAIRSERPLWNRAGTARGHVAPQAQDKDMPHGGVARFVRRNALLTEAEYRSPAYLPAQVIALKSARRRRKAA